MPVIIEADALGIKTISKASSTPSTKAFPRMVVLNMESLTGCGDAHDDGDDGRDAGSAGPIDQSAVDAHTLGYTTLTMTCNFLIS